MTTPLPTDAEREAQYRAIMRQPSTHCGACGCRINGEIPGRFVGEDGHSEPSCQDCWDDESGDSWPEWATTVLS